MKRMIVFIVFLLSASSVFAQDESNQSDEDSTTNSKRPSWSTGLPERKKTGDIPESNLESMNVDHTVEIDLGDFKFADDEEPVLTDSENVAESKQIEADLDVIIEPVIEAVVDPVTEPLYVTEPLEVTEANLSEEYEWVIVKQVAPKYPRKAAQENIEGWVDIEVVINEKGKVIDAVLKDAFTKNSEEEMVFVRPAIAAFKKWKFEAPGDAYTNQALSKVYRLNFNLN